MLSIIPLLALAGSATAHFRLLQPTWRGDSFAAPASQWEYPCANVNATATDSANRTQWPLTGGSVVFNGSHPWSMTYVNLAIGTNGTNFNITLVPGFNQTGPGVFCFKETGRGHLEEGLKLAGYSGLNDERLNGLDATVQVIQLGERGSALYNVCRPSIVSSVLFANDIAVRRCQVQLHRATPCGRSMQERNWGQRCRYRERPKWRVTNRLSCTRGKLWCCKQIRTSGR